MEKEQIEIQKQIDIAARMLADVLIQQAVLKATIIKALEIENKHGKTNE